MLAMRHGRGFWPRGKMLGGSSSMNGNIYARGDRRNFDDWARFGNRGWDYDSVLPYFRKSEDNGDARLAADRRHHGTGGYLKVQRYNTTDLMRPVIAAGWKELGLSEIPDYNADAKSYIGYTELPGTINAGVRSSAVTAFLVPVKGRPNLHIIKQAHATELLWPEDSAADPNAGGCGAPLSVEGVRFQRTDGTMFKARARKEVIVSGGTINTPQLLQLSGIGPKQQLAEHGIRVRADLPAGEHMQDHPMVAFAHKLHASSAQPRSAAEVNADAYEYLLHRTGRLSHVGVLNFAAFISTVGDAKYPDIQIFPTHMRRGQPEMRRIMHSFGFRKEVAEAFGRASDEADTILWLVAVLNPVAKGAVRLANTDPLRAPLIHTNYLGEMQDVRAIMGGIRAVRNLTRTRAFAEHEAEEVRIPLPACDALDASGTSDEYLECYARHLTSTLFHPVGTARMGRTADESVVDDQLRVHGVEKLRVVDASVMPEIVSCNTQAATYMIGEKGADIVKAAWGWDDRMREYDRDEL